MAKFKFRSVRHKRLSVLFAGAASIASLLFAPSSPAFAATANPNGPSASPSVIVPPPGGGAPGCGSSVYVTGKQINYNSQTASFKVVAVDMKAIMPTGTNYGLMWVYLYDATGEDTFGGYNVSRSGGGTTPTLYTAYPTYGTKPYITVLISNDSGSKTWCQKTINL